MTATGGTRKAKVGLGEPWRGSCGFQLCCKTSVNKWNTRSGPKQAHHRRNPASCPELSSCTGALYTWRSLQSHMLGQLPVYGLPPLSAQAPCPALSWFWHPPPHLHGPSSQLTHTWHLSGVTPCRAASPPCPAHAQTHPHTLSPGHKPHTGCSPELRPTLFWHPVPGPLAPVKIMLDI